MSELTNHQSVFEVSSAWKTAYPDAHAGILVMGGVVNPRQHPELDARKQLLQEQLRSSFASRDRSAIYTLPVIQAYRDYYRRFKQSYHVEMQLESIVFKGKNLPGVAALVEAMFMAEVKNLLLTAGHDLDMLQLPVLLDVASGDERYTLLRGEEQVLKAGDMMMSDREGIISSILYGPDRRTSITLETHNVLFAVYAPAGIEAEAVLRHLDDIQQNVLIVSPQADTRIMQVFGADESG